MWESWWIKSYLSSGWMDDDVGTGFGVGCWVHMSAGRGCCMRLLCEECVGGVSIMYHLRKGQKGPNVCMTKSLRSTL